MSTDTQTAIGAPFVRGSTHCLCRECAVPRTSIDGAPVDSLTMPHTDREE